MTVAKMKVISKAVGVPSKYDDLEEIEPCWGDGEHEWGIVAINGFPQTSVDPKSVPYVGSLKEILSMELLCRRCGASVRIGTPGAGQVLLQKFVEERNNKTHKNVLEKVKGLVKGLK